MLSEGRTGEAFEPSKKQCSFNLPLRPHKIVSYYSLALCFLTFKDESLDSVPSQSMWDLWWKKWRWNRFLSSASVFTCPYHATNATYFTCPYHATNATYFTCPYHATNTTYFTCPYHATNTTYFTCPYHATNATYFTCPYHATNATYSSHQHTAFIIRKSE